MDKKLSIDIIVRPDCKIIAVDNSDYNALGVDLEKHIMVDFLVYGSDTDVLSDSIKIDEEEINREQYLHTFVYEYISKKDGTYAYYKLVIPKMEHFVDPNDSTKYKGISKELFYYNNILYFSTRIIDQNSYTLEEVIEKSDKIDYLSAYKEIQSNNASQTFYCPKKMLISICKLQQCLVKLQKKLLFKGACSCSYDSCHTDDTTRNHLHILTHSLDSYDSCHTDDTTRNHRDFILSATYIFDYLKDIGNFAEAQRIIDNMSSCNSICNEDDEYSNGGCGCGNSI